METLFDFCQCPSGLGIKRQCFSDNYYAGNILLPNTHNGIPLVEVGNGAFAQTEEVSGVIIPSNYNVVGDVAFHNCVYLIYVDMSDSKVVLIGNDAFEYCDNLQTVEFSNCLKVIGDRAFNETSIRSLHLPKTVSIIGEYCFSKCENLQYITVDEENPYFDSRDNCNAVIDSRTNTLLYGCKNTTIPESVTRLADCAFSGSGIRELVIPENIVSIGRNCFYQCKKLETIYIPANRRHLLDMNPSEMPQCEVVEL